MNCHWCVVVVAIVVFIGFVILDAIDLGPDDGDMNL